MATQLNPHAIARRSLGAPESLRAALQRAADAPGVARVSRRELQRAADGVLLPRPAEVGTLRFVAVVPGGAEGLIYSAVASDQPRSDLTPVPGALADRILDWVRTTWPTLPLDGMRLHFTGPAPGERWSGRSCELALAAAAVSFATGRTPLAHVVASGRVEAPGQLGPVHHVQEKRAVVRRDLPQGHLVIASDDSHADTCLDALLGVGWRDALTVRMPRSLRRRSREAWAALGEGRYVEAEDEARSVLELATDPATRARAAWVLGSCALHAGRAAEGLSYLDEVEQLLPAWHQHPDAPPDELVLEELVAHAIVGLVDRGLVSEATRRGARALHTMGRPERRSPRWRMVALQIAGSLHRAAIARGDLEAAAELLHTYPLGIAALDHQRARALGDLAELHRRAGDLPLARRTLGSAREALLDTRGTEVDMTSRFLELYNARLHPEHTPAPREHPFWPELGFELLRASTAELGQISARPVFAHSQPLRLVLAAELARRPVTEHPPGLLARLLDDLTTDDEGLADVARRAAGGDAAASRELIRRCPY